MIVSYNTRDVLCKCLDSLHEFISGYDHEIIVVDNGSTDGTQERLRNSYQNVSLIENKNNAGFSKAVNTGLKCARGDVLGLINSDIIFIEDVFKIVLESMESDGEIGIIGCKLLNDDLTTQKSAYWRYPGLLEEVVEYGGFSDFINRLSLSIKYSLSTEEHDRDQEVAHLKGACLFLRRDLLESVGYLDERFFMYREETDYCKRTHDAGWKVYFLSSARVIHLHKVSSDKLRDKGIRIRLKSHYQYLIKHRGTLETSILYVIILLTSMFRCLLTGLKGGDGTYYSDIIKWHLGFRKVE